MRSPAALATRVTAPPPLYDGDRLFEEIAYIAYHFHWPLDEILDLEHPLRRRFVEEIARINQRRAEEE
ncbi:MAG: hypothetical protein E6J41_31980 [Chloroflexi bacterium]|nr:MAG: hypothetical protein E6J41_31980 [Chloroflexota bacterium]